MSLMTIFKSQAPSFAGFQFDAVFEDRVEMEIEIPSYPIEVGARVNDHRVIKPFKYSIVGGIGNNPLRTLATDFIGGAISNILPNNQIAAMFAGLSSGLLSNNGGTRGASVLDLLVQLAANSEPFDVDAVDIQLQNMVITRLYRERNPENENGLIFVAVLGELITLDRLDVRIGGNPENMPDGDPVKTAGTTIASRGQEVGTTPTGVTTYEVQELRDIQGVPI
ncbi:hypothetical protein CASP1_00070 [Alcaligenes phage CASP1]|nr:hypothetical protein CASP1_00070 [Alcaligenes phage CASP1]